MRRISKLLMAAALTVTLVGCGGQEQEDNTFVVGMECGYAPFNWQTSEEAATTVSLGAAGYADGYDVQIAKKIADERKIPLIYYSQGYEVLFEKSNVTSEERMK